MKIDETLSVLTYLENTAAEIDALFLEIVTLRKKGVLLGKHIDRKILNTYELLNSAYTLLISHIIPQKSTGYTLPVSHTEFIDADILSINPRKIAITVKKIEHHISNIKHTLIKMIEKLEKIHNLSIDLDPQTPIIDVIDSETNFIVLTLRALIILNKDTKKIIKLPLKEIASLEYRQTFRFKGIEIKLRNKKTIRISSPSNIYHRITKKIERLKKVNPTRLETYPERLEEKRQLVRPKTEILKIKLLQHLLFNKNHNLRGFTLS